MVNSVIQKFLNKNTARAAEHAAPLNYEECLSLIRLECQGEGIPETLLALGSCYSGSRAGGDSALEKKVDRCLKFMEQSSQKNNQSSSQGSSRQKQNQAKGNSSNNNNNTNARRGNKQKYNKIQSDYQYKLKSICVLYNNGSCPTPCVNGLRHICSKIIDTKSLRMCYEEHPQMDH